MRSSRSAGVIFCVVVIMASILSGCAEEEPIEVDRIEDLMESPVPPDLPPEERAAEIVAQVTRVGGDGVTIVDQAASGDMLTVNATIPAHEKLLAHQAAAPDTGGGAETEQRIEWVKVRWNTATDQPIDITWPERLQFAEEEAITEEQALKTAEDLKSEWFPEVPVEMEMRPPHRLNRPVWVIAWRGENEDGVLTGDQVAVQVSAVTGLPIAYSQRVAVQRPSEDEIEVTRDAAIEAAREALVEREVENAEGMPLVARLVLSAPEHPEGGPAWLVRGTGDRATLVVPVDAMSGEVLAEENAGQESE